MSFIYPRTIRITRPVVDSGLGPVDYNGLAPQNEKVIAQDLCASIQLGRSGGKPEGGLPADAANKTFWKVLIPLGTLNFSSVNVRDIITDELGNRYQVVAPYWNSLGYGLSCERLET